ncbi:hypothetical protein Q7P37_002344 [Cladosporium fusiforme]
MDGYTGHFDEQRPLAKAEQVNKILHYCATSGIQLPESLRASTPLHEKPHQLNRLLYYCPSARIDLPDDLLKTKPRVLLEDIPSELLQQIAGYLVHAMNFNQSPARLYFRELRRVRNHQILKRTLPSRSPPQHHLFPRLGFRVSELSHAFNCLLENFGFSTVMVRAAIAQFLPTRFIRMHFLDLFPAKYPSEGMITIGRPMVLKPTFLAGHQSEEMMPIGCPAPLGTTFVAGQLRHLTLDVTADYSGAGEIAMLGLACILPKIPSIFPGLVELRLCLCMSQGASWDPSTRLKACSHSMAYFAAAYFGLIWRFFNLPVQEKLLLQQNIWTDEGNGLGKSFNEVMVYSKPNWIIGGCLGSCIRPLYDWWRDVEIMDRRWQGAAENPKRQQDVFPDHDPPSRKEMPEIEVW